MSRFLKLLVAVLLIASPAAAGPLGLGRPATRSEIRAWDIDVRPDGRGLPDGHGTVAEGEQIFLERCATCHGDFGEGVDRWPVLAGGQDTLTEDRPVKTIGSYWPYLSTVWDYVHRAMPFGQPLSLDADQVYAIVAYLLYLNDLVDEDFELSRENFTEIHLPNENGFYDDPRPDIPTLAKDGRPCMTNCKEKVEITMRARVLDVTPEDETSRPRKPIVSDPGEPGGGDQQQGAASPTQETKLAAAAPAKIPAPDPAEVARGEKLFGQCRACHAVGEGAKSKVGPSLNGVVGRPAAAVEGFRYSKAMKTKGTEGLVWTPEALDAFLSGPRKFVPGTKMSFAGLAKAEDRSALIAYLRQFSR